MPQPRLGCSTRLSQSLSHILFCPSRTGVPRAPRLSAWLPSPSLPLPPLLPRPLPSFRLADNTYNGTFGAAGWGYRANEVLAKVKGKDFRHEKTKKKRGSYRGGKIETFAVNSFKFDQ